MIDRARLAGGVAAALEAFWFRGKGRLLHALCPRKGIASRTIFGVSIAFNLADWVQRSVFLGVYEPHETKWLKDYLRSRMIVVDVGANIGYYTLLAREAVGPAGRIIAFEPSPAVAGHLKNAVRGFNNITVIEAALGASAGDSVLYVDETAGNHTPTLVAHTGTSSVNVSMQTLDECASRLQLERIDLLKLDVEGWEPQVLEGAVRLLRERRVRAVLCEFNNYWLAEAGTSAAALWQRLMESGFVDSRAGHTMPAFDAGTETRFFLLDESDRTIRGS